MRIFYSGYTFIVIIGLQSAPRRYIVGVEVNEQDLKEYQNEEHSIILKVADK